ncbi:prenylcysteine oxidase-like [Ischnura elegans]|uniref:prenylcysteine oxidase-like n=1 Tax=Ischnura elegans TaxID=197161 RepID=UPI001ED890C8|nr:prenylcysteine oxidase-like [Ischnura elegans]
MYRPNPFPILLLFLSVRVSANPGIPKIAVVGAGLGGTSVSYFLQDIFGEGNVVVDVYEEHEIGGRLATVDIGDRSYEAGGSVIHPDNKYMAHFCKKFGLPKRPAGDPSSKFALYDGKDIVFEESDWEVVTWMKMLWRYGWSIIKLNNIVEKMLSEFRRIYLLQDRGSSYPSVEDLLRAMSPEFVNDVKVSSAQGFAKLGVSNRTIDEIVMAGLMVNYGQTTAAQKFVGSVSSAAGDGHLWSIAGGNKLIPEMLLKHSGANFIKAKVKQITLLQDSGNFNLSFISDGDDSPEHRSASDGISASVYETYDVVILAAPLTSDTNQIAFKNFPSSFSIPGGKYHRTVCTFVKGEINAAYFGMKEKDVEILSIKNDLKINSISRVHDVRSLPKSDDQKVWKVFSQKPLEDDDLKDLFSKIDETKVVDWLAYPHYNSYQKLGSFILHDKLYHVNAIEWAASAMEMSVIGAKNVALLAHKDWTGGFIHSGMKDEL